MEKKLLFIFNARAGKGSIKSRLIDIIDIFIKGGYEVTVHSTRHIRMTSGCEKKSMGILT